MRFGKFLAAGIPECGLGEAGKEVLEPVLLKREQAYSGPAGKLKAASAVFLLAGIICGLAGRECASLPAGLFREKGKLGRPSFREIAFLLE